jgi:hypothetical protein
MENTPLVTGNVDDSQLDNNGMKNKNMEDSSIYIFLGEIFGVSTTFETLYYYNFFTAFLHALSAILIFALSVNIKQEVGTVEQCSTRNFTTTVGPYLPAACWGDVRNNTRPSFNIQPEQEFDLKVYYAVLITTFFSLSAIFQAGQGISYEDYKHRVETNDVNYLRYIEYSLSASFMMVAISCSLMIYDIYSHVLVFTCTMICMLIGLVSDFLRMTARQIREQEPQGGFWDLCLRDLEHLKWFTHGLGWVAIMVPYCFVFAISYLRAILRSSDCLQKLDDTAEPVPGFVHLIIISQFALFSSFGLVQLFQFRDYPFYYKTVTPDHMAGSVQIPTPYPINSTGYKEGVKRIGMAAEHRFITLSAIAKTLLGWLIAANILFA